MTKPKLKASKIKGKFLKVITQENHTINAQKIVFCTGFESLNLLKEKVADLIYTYATVSEAHKPIIKSRKDFDLGYTRSLSVYENYG